MGLKNYRICRNCHFKGNGKYCAECGQEYQVRRITLSALIHDVTHLFTHLDKGFLHTMKLLMTSPGHFQLNYIEGNRSRHQKPFSMFFICASVAAILRYWVYSALIRYYNVGEVNEAEFFHNYMVLVHLFLLPLYVLVFYTLFKRSGYNYAETGVLVLYTFSIIFVIVTLISFLKFLSPELDTAYLEFPVILLYNMITMKNFYRKQRPFFVYLKAAGGVVFIFLIAHYSEEIARRLIFNN